MRGHAVRAEASTLVVVTSGSAGEEVHAVLDTLVRTSGVRPVVVTLGAEAAPQRSDRDGTTVIEGLVPRYLNNAVASLRLSSLPAIAWWREPRTDGLMELADLIDRLVLDVDEPARMWALVPELSKRTAVSDLRWSALTRWRDLFAQFFDLPDVRAAAESFTRLEIVGSDASSGRLLGGWIRSRLPGGERLEVSVTIEEGPVRLRSLRLAGESAALSLRLLPNDICIETVATLAGVSPCSRVVPAGDQHIAALMGQELRVRSRDIAFEDAVAAAGGIR